MKEILIPVKLPGEQAINTIAELEQHLAQLNDELKETQIGSRAFQDLQQKIGAAKVQMQQFEREIERVDPVKKAEQFVKMGEGIAGGFAIATGALTAFGAESEEVAAIEAKAQGAIAIAMGVRAIREGEVIEMLKNSKAAKLAVAAAEKVMAFATEGTTLAVKGLRAALIASGIGAFIVAIGTLIGYSDEIKAFFSGGASKAKDLARETEKVYEANKKALDSFDLMERRMRALGVAESEIIAKKKEMTIETLKSAKAQLEAQQMVVDETLKSFGQARASAASGNIGGVVWNWLFGASEDDVKEALAKEESISNAVQELDTALLEMQKEASDKIIAEENARQEKLNAAAEEQKKARIEKQKQEAAERLAVREEFSKLYMEATMTEEDLAITNLEAEIERFRQAGADKVQLEEYRQARMMEITTAGDQERAEQAQQAATALLNLQRENALLAIRDAEEKMFAELELQKQQELESLASYENYELLKEQVEQKYAERRAQAEEQFAKAKEEKDAANLQKELQNQKQVEQAKINLASGAISSLIALNEAWAGKTRAAQKRAFAVNKALGIAQASITTYQSAVAAYASQLAIPSPDAPVRAAIAAGVAVAAGLAQITKIAATKFDDSGSSSGAPTGGGGSASFGGGGGAQANPLAGVDLSFLGNGDVQNIGTNQGQNTPSGKGSALKAYVVSTEVTSQQSADEQINNIAKL